MEKTRAKLTAYEVSKIFGESESVDESTEDDVEVW